MKNHAPTIHVNTDASKFLLKTKEQYAQQNQVVR